MFGVCALLAAGPAQSEEIYAKVGRWEITAEPPSPGCMMSGAYASKDGKKLETLTIGYAGDTRGAVLIWSNDWMTYLPAEGDLELGLAFKKGVSVDQSWGRRNFHYHKVNDTYIFKVVFTNAEEAQRLLRSIAGNERLGLLLGPALTTSLPLDPAEAVEKLRECSVNGGRAP
jgi:hypothetical protein